MYHICDKLVKEMINATSIFDEIKNSIMLRCVDTYDQTDLAQIADTVVSQEIPLISVDTENVGRLWTWLEAINTKIIAQFKFERVKKSEFVQEISKLSTQINTVFKKGAHGAEISLPYSELNSFVSEIMSVRDDLFFNKDLIIAIDINEVDTCDWANLFLNLTKIRAGALMLYATDKKVDDFVGRIYALMEFLENGFDGDLFFATGNAPDKIEQVWRLAQKIRPEMCGKIKFFITT